MTNKNNEFNSDEFIELLKQLTKADQKKVLWRIRWLVFKNQFSREAIKNRAKKLLKRINLLKERIQFQNSHHPIEDEINKLWKDAKKDYNLKVTPGIDFFQDVSKLKKRLNLDFYAKIYLQPWLYIFDQGIVWLTTFYFTFTEGNKPKNKNTNPIEYLLGTACTQANSIRILCAEGLDLPAKAILRTFLETLMTCIVITYDEGLRKGYQDAQGFKDSWNFWRKYLREKKLLQTIREIFIEHGLRKEQIDEFTEWMEEEFRVTSQAVHPSYLASTLATFPYPLVGDKLYPGILGSPTASSHRTLSLASKFLWFFSMITVSGLLTPQKGKKKPLLSMKKGSDTSKLSAMSYSIYWQLVQSHWDDELTVE